MKTLSMAAALFFVTGSFAPTQSMPGMDMPGQPKTKASPKRTHAPSTKKSGSAPQKPTSKDAQLMPGMDMGGQHDNSMKDMDISGHQGQTMPGMDMSQHEAPSGQPAKGSDMKNMQGMHMDTPMTQAPQNGSITHDSMNLQEPENPSHKTGSNIPAPDLLKDVVHRQPMALGEFLALADKMNPTLAQANAFVTRSAAQARQAGLYPNPSVGYQGDQIRGGSYGGGEQGAYVQQTIVLGGKLGLRKDIYNQQKRSDQIGVEEQTFVSTTT